MSTRVMVIEDDELVRSYLHNVLERGGCEVVEAPSGKQALEMATDAHPDVVVVDGLLPDYHGVDLAQKFLEIDHGFCPGICFVSGALHEDVEPKAGIAALTKPTRPGPLLEMVESLSGWSHNPVHEDRSARKSALDEVTSHFFITN